MINVPDPHKSMKDQLVSQTERLQRDVRDRQVTAQEVADREASARASASRGEG